MQFEVRASDPSSCATLRKEYLSTLTAPMDDMWAAFADMAEPFLLLLDGEPIGFCSISTEGELHRFFVRPEHEQRAGEFLRSVIADKSIAAALPATVDPAFLSSSLDVAKGFEVKALLFEHVLDPLPTDAPLAAMRTATPDDLQAAVEFEQNAVGMPEEFLQPYLSTRIVGGELLLHEIDGSIVGCGEIRADRDATGFAHLGVVVAENQRGNGVGGRIFNYLVEECRRQGTQPLCSTEPANLAARRIIEGAGFRTRNRLLKVNL